MTQIEQYDTNKAVEEVKTEKKKDSFAKFSLGLGLASILFAWIGIVPLLAIILGVVAIGRTKEEGTGRWMAVVGLILGIIFFISNMYMNGHFSSEALSSRTSNERNLNTRINTPTTNTDTSFSPTAVAEKESSTESDLIEDVPQKQTKTASVIHSVTPQPTPTKEQVDINLTKSVITPTVSEVEETPSHPIYSEIQVWSYNQTKEYSEKLDGMLSEAKKILSKIESANKEQITACKATYDTEVASIQSRWNTDSSYYKTQIEEQKDSSYQRMVEAYGSGSSYLQEQLESKEQDKDRNLQLAKSRYESCKTDNKLDSTNRRELSDITSEQKKVMSGLNKENSENRFNDMKDLIIRADKLLVNLRIPLFLW